MPVGDTPPATIPVYSLGLFRRAVELLKQNRPGLKVHRVRTLFPILHAWGSLPDVTQPGVGAGTLEILAYDYYTKERAFRIQGQQNDWLKLFGDMAPRAENDFRASFNAQKGFGCFATPKELQDLIHFKPELRSNCSHRGAPAGGARQPGAIGCWLGPQQSDGTYPPCFNPQESGGQMPKLLRQEGSRNARTYQKVEPVAEDMDLLTEDGEGRVPLYPLLAALYGGSQELNPNRGRKGLDDLLNDHHINPAWLNRLIIEDRNDPDNAQLLAMTESVLLVRLHEWFTQRGLILRRDEVINFFLSLKPRAFVVLSGISGTGKSWLCRLLAEALLGGAGTLDDDFLHIPVGSNWRDKTYLLGFWNHLTGSFEPGPLWTAVVDAEKRGDSLPFFALLDETNLARIEYYFGDFLSVMETREFVDGAYETLPLVFAPKPDYERSIPDNLFIVGTVNVDESTHGLSRKVLDRANTIELDEVDLSKLPDDSSPVPAPEELAILGEHLRDRRFRRVTDVASAYPEKAEEWNDFVQSAQGVLKIGRRHFGARVRDEILMYMGYAWDLLQDAQATEADLAEFNEVRALDFQFMQKVVPRLFGTKEELEVMLEELMNFADQHKLSLTKNKLERMSRQEVVSPWSA
jgi:MoxR-like ATPase